MIVNFGQLSTARVLPAMSSIYDDLYKQPDYYGIPLANVLKQFNSLRQGCRILDVGCGQGRYSIALAQMGHKVTALDNNALGLKQVKNARANNLISLQIIHADAYTFQEYDKYDVIFFNLFFHFNPFEKERELKLLKRLFKEISSSAEIIISGYREDESELLNFLDECAHITIAFQKEINLEFEDSLSGLPSKARYFFLRLQPKI